MRPGLAAAAFALALGASGPRGSAQDAAAAGEPALRDLDRASQALVERCGPSIVRVEADRSLRLRVIAGTDEERRALEEQLRAFGPRESVDAAGFLVDEAGFVVTTSAVAEGAGSIRVTFHRGTVLQGSLVGEDPLSGVAVVRVAPPEGVRALRLSGEAARPGALSLFLVPQAGEPPALHLGFVTATRRAVGPYDAYLVSSVPPAAGCGGAPLLDARGEVMGIAVAPRVLVSVRTWTGPAPPSATEPPAAGQTLGRLVERSAGMERTAPFATFVPAGELRRIVSDIRELGRVRRGMLGIRLPGPSGDPVVEEVLPGTPAEKAGLAPGDRILAVDGIPVASAAALSGFIQRRAPGTGMALRVRGADGTVRDANAVLAEVPTPPRGLFDGIGVQDQAIPEDLRGALGADPSADRCLFVSSVGTGTSAERAGLRIGDAVISVNGIRVYSEASYADVAVKVPPGQAAVEIVVLRAGRRLALSLE